MDESDRQLPEAEKRLTREDVLRLIEEHGGPEGLDVSDRDLRGADLSELDLHGANLQGADLRWAKLEAAHLWHANLQGARLWEANLQGADLRWAKLEAAHLWHANLQGARLWEANLQGADLSWVNLEGASLWRANLQGVDLTRGDLRRARLAYATLRGSKLEDVNWADYLLDEEIHGPLGAAASAYRTLKQWHTEAGMYDIAGEFHYREMEARRKLAWRDLRLPYAVALSILGLLYGYGERPMWVAFWAATVVFGLALVHWLFGTVTGGFLDALYYSAVSFPALGYGEWAPEPQGWAGRFLGAGESFMGVFMMALFLVTFTRKMTR